MWEAGSTRRRNQGIGEFDLPERGFTSKESVFEVQVGHHMTGRRYENDFRFGLVSGNSELSSVSDARTIRVLDAFTSGGAQQLGGQRSQSFELEHELQFTAGGHKLTAGSFINGSYYRGDQVTATRPALTRLPVSTRSRPVSRRPSRNASGTQRIGTRCTALVGTRRTTIACVGIWS